MFNENKILITSGDDNRRMMLNRLLIAKGMNAESLSDFYRIQKKMETENYKVLILDMVGVNRDPSYIISHLKRKKRNCYMVVLTDLGNIYAYGDQLESFADKLLLNPLNVEALLLAVESNLEIIETKNYKRRISAESKLLKINKHVIKKVPNSEYERKIIAIGGGKGGVGKSILTANLAHALANEGKRVVAVDLDLGGPNLHTFLGMRNLKKSLYDFLLRKKSSLSEVTEISGTSGLRVIGINENLPSGENIKFAQKIKLINNLKKINADYILLDLGAGTSFNVIDFFSVTEDGIIVTSPEVTSILNSYQFIKSLLFRKMERTFRLNNKDTLCEILKKSFKVKDNYRATQVLELNDELIASDPDAKELLYEIKKGFNPRLILNMVGTGEGEKMGRIIVETAKRYLDVDIDLLGYIRKDPIVEASVSSMTPFVKSDPTSFASNAVQSIGIKIINNKSYENNYTLH